MGQSDMVVLLLALVRLLCGVVVVVCVCVCVCVGACVLCKKNLPIDLGSGTTIHRCSRLIYQYPCIYNIDIWNAQRVGTRLLLHCIRAVLTIVICWNAVLHLVNPWTTA